MTRTVTQIAVEMSELRSELAGLMDNPDSGEQRDKIVKRLADLEPEHRTALVLQESEVESRTVKTREALRDGVEIREYLRAAGEDKPLEGRAAEYNADMGLNSNRGGVEVPMEFIAPQEGRATIAASSVSNVDQLAGGPGARWTDRLFRNSMANRVGITFDTVDSGDAIYPITAGTSATTQAARADAIGESAFTFSLHRMTPKRYGISYRIAVEDMTLLPQLEDAVRRDVQSALNLHIDNAVFTGADATTGTTADVAGLTTASGVENITAVTLANSAKPVEYIKALASKVDGIKLLQTLDINLVLSNHLAAILGGTVMGTTDIAQLTFADQWLRDQVGSYGVVNGLSANATLKAADVVAVGSYPVGLPGAGVVAMWPSLQLIRDPYSSAAKGEVVITMQGLYDMAIVRSDQFFKVTLAA